MILLLSGPNLNLLGQREPEIYGTATLEDHVARARAVAEPTGSTLEHLQSNHEGELVEAIHEARGRCAAIVINPGAFTHYAWGLHDALAAFDGPIVELHLSNPNAGSRGGTRRWWRRWPPARSAASAGTATAGRGSRRPPARRCGRDQPRRPTLAWRPDGRRRPRPAGVHRAWLSADGAARRAAGDQARATSAT